MSYCCVLLYLGRGIAVYDMVHELRKTIACAIDRGCRPALFQKTAPKQVAVKKKGNRNKRQSRATAPADLDPPKVLGSGSGSGWVCADVLDSGIRK